MGYGNQAPVTKQGRTLIYTLGFASLLAFGAILARAGQVVSFLFDDAVIRIRWTFLLNSWVSCLVWGVLYYTWMLVIAATTMNWKKTRLDETFDLNDAYWCT